MQPPSSLPAPPGDVSPTKPERVDASAPPVPASPPGRLDRVVNEARTLSGDVVEWVNLRIELTKLEIQEQINEKKADAISGAVAGILALFGVIFLLTAAAWGLGAWLGHPGWGFLIVAGVLLLGALLAFQILPGALKKR